MFSAESDVLRGGGCPKSRLGSSCKEKHEHTDMDDDPLKNHGLFSVVSINISTSLAYV